MVFVSTAIRNAVFVTVSISVSVALTAESFNNIQWLLPGPCFLIFLFLFVTYLVLGEKKYFLRQHGQGNNIKRMG